MRQKVAAVLGVATIGVVATLSVVMGAAGASATAKAPTVSVQQDALLRLLAKEHGLSKEQVAKVERVFAGSPFLGSGNPAVTEHPMTRAQCRERRHAAGIPDHASDLEAICGSPQMVPLHGSRTPDGAGPKACIDAYEFPNVPCEYPVVWVKASEAAAICSAVGKRLCDAHEWEGACAGALAPPDYRFDLAEGKSRRHGAAAMRRAHNAAVARSKSWSYGADYEVGVCAAGSKKTKGCDGGSFRDCGSNTYPAGAFPRCRSALGVYDINGNAAEHMNLPLALDQMASRGSTSLGVTEMKGSWFIFDSHRAHEDWCRWRAPFWHGTRVRSDMSHANYHLGFRCCKTL